MAENAIRFGVRSETGATAATWKCWTVSTRRNDVYLACRALKGELKVSLHQSGRWHIGYTEPFFAEAFSDSSRRPKSRFIQSWRRPQPMMPGVTLALRVMTPWSSLTESDEKRDPRVIAIPPAPAGQAVEVAIVITSESYLTPGWPGQTEMGTSLVGSLALPNGDKVWLVYRNIPFAMPTSERGQGTFFKGFDRTALKKPGLRAIVFGSEPGTVYDVAVVAKNGLPSG